MPKQARDGSRRPPEDIGQRRLRLARCRTVTSWLRAAIPRPGRGDKRWLAWDNRHTSRFSHPDSPFRVLYLGRTRQTCFWETFGEELLDTAAGQARVVATSQLEARSFVTFRLPKNLRLFDSTNATALQAIGADNNTFRLSYEHTQAWARVLMEHPAKPDGILYESRHSLEPDRLCLALFERESFLKPSAIKVAPMGPMIDDLELLRYLDVNRIGLMDT